MVLGWRGAGDSHRTDLAKFQQSESSFVYGYERDSGRTWFLEEGGAAQDRTHVKDHVVCPVPECKAPLTTVARSRGRDGLRHLAGRGGHGLESEDHANGCAAIHHWLQTAYPRSQVQREQYTSVSGERRADVLVRGPAGDRIAFEVQYSPLTPAEWTSRHNSYRAQGVVDIWLFGHRGPRLKIDTRGNLKLNPTHEAVIAAGSPLLFFNPESLMVAVAYGQVWSQDQRLGPVAVLDAIPMSLALVSLADMKLHQSLGLTSELLEVLQGNRTKIADYEEAEIRRRLSRQELWAEWRAVRGPELENVRVLLAQVDVWSSSEALQAARDFFGASLGSRFDLHRAEKWSEPVPEQWQCAIYFELIAGRSDAFTVPHASSAVGKYRAGIAAARDWKAIARYLWMCERRKLLEAEEFNNQIWFTPTERGAWR